MSTLRPPAPSPGGAGLSVLLLLLAAASPAAGEATPQEDRPGERAAPAGEDLEGLAWRSLGPANMGGRVTDLAVVEEDPRTFYVGTATGGVWRTTNAGTTFEPAGEGPGTNAVGALAVAPSMPQHLWVGTGEAWWGPGAAWGGGVYRSTDGGASFQHMGLERTRHVARIRVHPADPHMVYVAALGPQWTDGGQRGLFRTRDGGRTWELCLDTGPGRGCCDVVMHPVRPEVLYAAVCSLRPAAAEGTGERSGIYRSTDAGESWTRLEEGLPAGPLGLIALGMSSGDPQVLVALVGAAGTAKETSGGVFRSGDGGRTWRRVRDPVPSGGPPPRVVLDPRDARRVWITGSRLLHSVDSGGSFKVAGAWDLHPGPRALWIDPRDPRHMLLGNDGGLAVTHDRGATWELFHNLPLARFHGIAAGPGRIFRVFGCLDAGGTWCTPARTRDRLGLTRDHAFEVHPERAWDVARTPGPHPGLYIRSRDPALLFLELESGLRRRVPFPAGEGPHRSARGSPVVVCPHNPGTVWCASQRVFRSVDRGVTLRAASGDLARTASGAVSALAVSPHDERVVWAGTDDGALWVTRNGGLEWVRLDGRLPAEVSGHRVAHIACSTATAGSAHILLDGHRSGDLRSHVLRGLQHGARFEVLGAELPEGPAKVLLEDPAEPRLLFLGTQCGLVLSPDGGGRWLAVPGLPTIPVSDLALQESSATLVVGTLGRGLWVLDVDPLRHLEPGVAESAARLLPPRRCVDWIRRRGRGRYGHRHFHAERPPAGAHLWYWLGASLEDGVRLEVRDLLGKTLKTLEGPGERGLHRVVWDLSKGRGRKRRHLGSGTYEVRLTAGKTTERRRLVVEPDPLRGEASPEGTGP